jgi:hypothetical protein
LFLLLGSGAARAQANFAVGLQDDGFGPKGTAAQTSAAYGATRAVRATYVRIPLEWASVVRGNDAAQVPNGFNQADPRDNNYKWTRTDEAVSAAAAHHLTPILVLDRAPVWAEGPGTVKPATSPGAWNPNPTMFARFVRAAALRYSGSFPDPAHPGSSLPRVKYWEPWNEPNIPGFFNAPNTITAYRTLLNNAYASLKGVRGDNVVMLGGLAPVSSAPGSTPPFSFAAAEMCLRPVGTGFRRVGGCQSARFDALAIHPYSLAATPTKRAFKSGDMLVGDVGKVRTLLQAAGNRYPLWVTEFGWFTNPPDSEVGDPPATAARYVAWSMYQMWKAGASVVIWFGVLDTTSADTFSGGGLYSSNGQPKTDLSAFGFPFVAGVTRHGGWAWGRVPQPGARTVSIQRQSGRRWISVATVRTGSDGVFNAAFAARGNATYRARASGGPTSLSYNSQPIPPKRTHVFNP